MGAPTRRTVLASLLGVAAVASCGRVRDSRLNPFNWFGRSREEEVEQAPSDFVNDTRQYVQQVISLNVDPTPEGAIIRTVGLPPLQGYWDASLVLREDPDPTRLVYDFRVSPPLRPIRQGTQQSREILAGASISERRLRNVRSITVVGSTNQRTVRR